MSNRKITITESERKRIKNLYETPVSLDFVISDWLSPDEKYAIFLDELFDIESKTKLGNIWENFDNFKFFLKHSFEVSTNIPQQIKEDVLKTLDSFLLTESTQNLTSLKPIFKQLLKEDWGVLGDLGNWAKETATGAVKGVTDFVKTGYEGLKKLGIAISEGDWMKIVDLLKKGALYVARSIRSALYNPVGLILDAILIATGIGKGFQFVVWSIVVALDIYELISGNYEDPNENMITRLLFFGIDIIGLVFAGAAAKTSKGIVGSLLRKFGTSTKGLSEAAKSSPQFKGILTKILEGSTKASSIMTRAAEFLKTKSPMMYKFLSGIMNGLTKFITKLINSIKAVLGFGLKVLSSPGKLASKLGGGKAVQATANTLTPLAALGTYQKYKERDEYDQISNALSGSNVKPDYDSVEW
jgi:hypothetical protein